MQYFFILGNNPTLSIAELSAVFAKEKLVIINKNVLLIEIKKIESRLINKLGGTIKLGKIISQVDNNQKNILAEIKKILKPKQGKFKFGISYYSKKQLNTKPLAMKIKNYLKEKGVSSRWVTSKEKTLSSVVVEQNKLISKGIEIILIEKEKQVLIGKTLSVQPFKQLSNRDYGRPARDDYSGMLPPKLAQVMINLSQAKADDTILDPFCGSGTILTEAMLMSYKNLIGSDTSKKAVDDTKQNIHWTKKQYPRLQRELASGQAISNIQYQLINSSVTAISQYIKPRSINAIITEPYLGPQRGKYDIIKVGRKLEKLYSQALKEFKPILARHGCIVIIFPVWRQNKLLKPELHGFKIIHPIAEYLKNHPAIKLTKRNTIIYGRVGQKVWREIIKLEP